MYGRSCHGLQNSAWISSLSKHTSRSELSMSYSFSSRVFLPLKMSFGSIYIIGRTLSLTVLLENLMVAYLAEKFPPIYENQRFRRMFTCPGHEPVVLLTLCWLKVIIFLVHLCHRLFHCGFPIKRQDEVLISLVRGTCTVWSRWFSRSGDTYVGLHILWKVQIVKRLTL